jgi:NADH-quinone oxidoreductase subunit L
MMVLALVFLPLFAALIVGLTVRSIPPALAEWLTSLCVVTSAVLAAFVFNDVVLQHNVIHLRLAPWIQSGNFEAFWALKVDALTAVMLVVVTWVSSVVHLYSIGYMHHDPHRPRFMAYLSLFTFCMLMLVTADNFLQLFFGWEGVGVCSYLLIGFWFHKNSANAASMKAFLVNRVGDFGFALGIFAVFLLFGSIEFDTVFDMAAGKTEATLSFLGYEFHALTLICLLLFIGCMGKSAQLGLHTWLPDAMEGPTPVSALIHAATMVTAGVFMIARCSPLFELAPDALRVVTIVGACTAIFAATIGLVQTDIKRVIAYSTCSQLGYMFFACGVGAYAAAIFHLATHAFFKALLFLGAGSVIHAMSDEQDITKMGGIARKIPITYAYMWIGSLALAGVPLFAGYYSKDIILESAYAVGTDVGRFAFWIGISGAFLTAFYSWRLLILTFNGNTRADHHTFDHVHESPKIMTVPLLLLAVGAITSGFLGANVLGMVSPEGHFWNGAIFTGPKNHVLHAAHEIPGWAKLLPTLVGVGGILLAYLCYLWKPELPRAIAGSVKGLHRFLLNKWYVDELYNTLFVRPARQLGTHLWQWWDARMIDGLGPNGVAWLSRGVGAFTVRLQTGYVTHYAFGMMLGVVVLLTWVLWHA